VEDYLREIDEKITKMTSKSKNLSIPSFKNTNMSTPFKPYEPNSFYKYLAEKLRIRGISLREHALSALGEWAKNPNTSPHEILQGLRGRTDYLEILSAIVGAIDEILNPTPTMDFVSQERAFLELPDFPEVPNKNKTTGGYRYRRRRSTRRRRHSRRTRRHRQ
jgi:hypothetical protein